MTEYGLLFHRRLGCPSQSLCEAFVTAGIEFAAASVLGTNIADAPKITTSATTFFIMSPILVGQYFDAVNAASVDFRIVPF